MSFKHIAAPHFKTCVFFNMPHATYKALVLMLNLRIRPKLESIKKPLPQKHTTCFTSSSSPSLTTSTVQKEKHCYRVSLCNIATTW